MNERTDRKANEQWMKNHRKESEISQLAINRNKKKNCLQLHERSELSTPGLRDQCSDH